MYMYQYFILNDIWRQQNLIPLLFSFRFLSDCVFSFTHKYFIKVAIFVHTSSKIDFFKEIVFEHSFEIT